MRTILNTYAWEEAIFLFWGKTRAEQSENKSGRAPFLLPLRIFINHTHQMKTKFAAPSPRDAAS